MAGPPVLHHGTPLGSQGGGLEPAGQPSSVGHGVFNYSEHGPVGFDLLPAEVRSAVAGSLPSPRFAAGADRVPVVKRRPDGSCYQFQAGWWLSVPMSGAGSFVVVEARRALTAVGQRSWRPLGSWQATTSTLLLTPARPYKSSWRPRSGPDPGKVTAGAPETTDDIARVLPSEVWAPMNGAKWSAWLMTFPNGSVEETIVAALASNERVRSFVAKRSAPIRAALSSGTWQVETLDAVVVATGELAAGRANRLRPASAPHQLPQA